MSKQNPSYLGNLSLLVRRDFTLFWRNGQGAAVIGIGLVIVLLILFLPGDLQFGGATTSDGSALIQSLEQQIHPSVLPSSLYLGPVLEPVPANLTGIPVFIAFEVAILGFLLIAVFVFQEKQEGTIRAYRVSPGTISTYILSKVLIFTLVSLVYGLVIVLAGWTLKPDWLRVLGLTLITSGMMTLLGLGFSSWFSNLSGWFFPGLAMLVLNILPIFSYLYPAFDPGWIRWIPSYGILFALEESLFWPQHTQAFQEALMPLVGWTGFSVLFCWFSVRRSLLQEVT